MDPLRGDGVGAIPGGGRIALDDFVRMAAKADGAGRQTTSVCARSKNLRLALVGPVSAWGSIAAMGGGGRAPARFTEVPRAPVTT
jgi:hypothetical protein